MTTTIRNDHSAHSALVRSWRLKPVMNSFDALYWTEEPKYHVLRSPYDGYTVSVSFSTYADHPDLVRVRSTNWRCEHEPSGIVSREDARRFYRALLDAGFVTAMLNAEEHVAS